MPETVFGKGIMGNAGELQTVFMFSEQGFLEEDL